MSSFPEEAFRRTDEAPDEEFYRPAAGHAHRRPSHSRRHATVQRAFPAQEEDPRPRRSC